MLAEANIGFLFHAPDSIKKQFPQFNAVDAYADLMKLKESTTLAVCGNNSLNHAPDWPCCANLKSDGAVGHEA